MTKKKWVQTSKEGKQLDQDWKWTFCSEPIRGGRSQSLGEGHTIQGAQQQNAGVWQKKENPPGVITERDLRKAKSVTRGRLGSENP